MAFFLVVYLILVLLDAPILLFGLSGAHSRLLRLLAALWVAACAFPLGAFIPGVILTRTNTFSFVLAVVTGLVIAAAVIEGALYWIFYKRRQRSKEVSLRRDVTAIIAANLVAIAMGRVIWGLGGV
jgi:hypothetical protein